MGSGQEHGSTVPHGQRVLPTPHLCCFLREQLLATFGKNCIRVKEQSGLLILCPTFNPKWNSNQLALFFLLHFILTTTLRGRLGWERVSGPWSSRRLPRQGKNLNPGLPDASPSCSPLYHTGFWGHFSYRAGISGQKNISA